MGRPREKHDIPLKKWSYITKDHTDLEQEIFYDEEKYSKGVYNSKIIKWGYGNTPHSPPKVTKGQIYNDLPIVMVFKTSNRSNAKTKIKFGEIQTLITFVELKNYLVFLTKLLY